MTSAACIRLVAAGLAALCALSGAAWGEDDPRCSREPPPGRYGPFDYRTSTQKQKELVERFHFTPDVEQLVRGNTTTYVAGDLTYTLTVFPNHPRALLALVNLSFKENREQPRGALWPLHCYFERAMKFTPDDGTVRFMYGYYLLRKGDPKDAVSRFKEASKLLGEDLNVHYNLGLAYFELKDYDQALEHAKRAYALGHPLPGLRDKLKRAGKWES